MRHRPKLAPVLAAVTIVLSAPIRAEDILLVEPSDDVITGVVDSVVFKGVHYEMIIESETACWMVQSTIPAMPGSRVGLSFGPDDIHIMAKSVFSPDSGLQESVSIHSDERGGEPDE